jgi:hypothetical protein
MFNITQKSTIGNRKFKIKKALDFSKAFVFFTKMKIILQF